MQSLHRRVLITAAMAAIALIGCSLPVSSVAPTPGAADYGATIAAVQTRSVETAAAQGFGAQPTPSSRATVPPAQTGAPQGPVVLADTLCWRGPGPDYEVISALLKGTAVSLLGRGAVAGWYVLRNPIYGDPCWIQASALQIPAGLDVSALPLYNPPFTATPTASLTPLVSATPTSTLAVAPSSTPSATGTP